jgi:serine/threonine protein kinase
VSEVAPIFDLVKDAWSGKKLGRFEVICKLGAGGMSEVFLAWQRGVGGFKRPVVLKRILDTVKAQDDFVQMFVREAKIMSALTHGSIAQLHDLSEENGELFMIMEFVPGATLVEVARACLNASESIPIGLTLAVVRETALALHYAHTFKDAVGRPRPVIHRDIAEKNIMLSLDGKTKLLDFGIARQQGRTSHTQVGTVKGTAGYMSPEQVKGEALDGRTDVFSLGIVLHECLTGQRLFKAATRQDEIQALLEGAIPLPSSKNRGISPALDAVVMKALSRDRNGLYATAHEFAHAFDRLAGIDVWSEAQRADFMQRHFEKRRKQIASFIGDPSMSESGEVRHHTDETPAVGFEVGDDDPSTVLALRPRAPKATTQPLGNAVGARATLGEGLSATRDERGSKSMASTRDERGGKETIESSSGVRGKGPSLTADGPREAEDAGATIESESDETHSGISAPGVDPHPGVESNPGVGRGSGADELTHATQPGSVPSRRKGSKANPQLLVMLGVGATLLLAILLVLFW